MKKSIFAAIAVILVVSLFIFMWFLYNANKYTPATYIETPGPNSTLTATSTISKDQDGNKVITKGAPSFTLEEIKGHTTVDSCYTVINGVVYDVTLWVNLHPGGKGAILSICGIDGTEKFLKKHGTGQKYANILSRYKIGTLEQ